MDFVGGGCVAEVCRLKRRWSFSFGKKRVARIFHADLAQLEAFGGENAIVNGLEPVVVQMQASGWEWQDRCSKPLALRVVETGKEWKVTATDSMHGALLWRTVVIDDS